MPNLGENPLPRISGLFDQPVALGLFLDQLPLGILVLDTERRIILVNRAIEGLSGFGREEARGIPCRYILRSNLCLKHCPAEQAMETDEPVSMEGDIISRDRQKTAVRMTSVPLRDTNGNLVGFLESVQDMRQLLGVDERHPQAYGYGEILGRSPLMEELFRILPMIAQTDSAILVTGETGTGKDLLAEAVHRSSSRSGGPFIKVNCGALPETLLESELFGHKKGAFTGAVDDKPGRIRLAHNGTLYLTEIGDLPLSLQVKLLTFLDDKVVHPLGSTKGFAANVRIIAATHRDLERMVREGRFREDLLYRLNVVRLHLPALKERGDDVGLLMDHFLHLLSTRFGKRIRGYSLQARELLASYAYPGNVRELRNIVEYAANICQEDQIKLEHFPTYLTGQRSMLPSLERREPTAFPPEVTSQRMIDRDMNWEDIERQIIVDALVKAKGRRSKAAGLLGWGRSTLWRKMKQYGIGATDHRVSEIAR
jgi:two-component system response regulator AtoC